MITLFLLAQITTSAPPLSPEQAVAALLKASPDLNRTAIVAPAPADGPTWVASDSKQGDGPFGSFPKQQFRPLGVHYVHGITYRLPRADNRSGRTR